MEGKKKKKGRMRNTAHVFSIFLSRKGKESHNCRGEGRGKKKKRKKKGKKKGKKEKGEEKLGAASLLLFLLKGVKEEKKRKKRKMQEKTAQVLQIFLSLSLSKRRI